MSTFSLSRPSSHATLGSRAIAGPLSLARRIVVSWRARRAERILTSLSYETLKDIGFPANTDNRNTPAR